MYTKNQYGTQSNTADCTPERPHEQLIRTSVICSSTHSRPWRRGQNNKLLPLTIPPTPPSPTPAVPPPPPAPPPHPNSHSSSVSTAFQSPLRPEQQGTGVTETRYSCWESEAVSKLLIHFQWTRTEKAAYPSRRKQNWFLITLTPNLSDIAIARRYHRTRLNK